MAASTFHGKAGLVYWNGTEVADITDWSATVTVDIADNTVMSNANTSRTYTAGFKDWSASINWVGDSEIGIPVTEGAEYDLELWLTNTAGDGILHGTAICTGSGSSLSSTDVGKGSTNFVGNDADGLQWAVTDPSA